MALTLEVEFLSGVCFAAIGPDSNAPDWPPQPDRVYSALVATWGAHGQPEDERRALEWLEQLAPPMCQYGEGIARDAPVVFVPPNDPSVQRAKLAMRVMPALRNRQPRRFPAAWLSDRLVRHYWPSEPDDAILDALDRLARDTSYIGHSSSLTRCRFSRASAPDGESLKPARRRIYPGRLQELCAAYSRFERSADKKDRPGLGAQWAPPQRTLPPPTRAFSDHWLVLEYAGGDASTEMPDLRAAALVSRGIRIALMSGYGRLGLPIPAEVSGHEEDGSPARGPHMAVVPMSFSGFDHADGRVLGFGVVPPEGSGLLEDQNFIRVLRHLTEYDPNRQRRWLDVKSPEGTPKSQAYSLRLYPSFEAPSSSKQSLDPSLYTRAAHHFATVTPIALDRHPKSRGAARQEEIASLIAAACVRTGLPEPDLVVPDKHAMGEGVPSAYPSGNGPDWMRWRVPESLSGRLLTHAFIRFKEPVAGPVLLGAGRFVGLGLCRPLPGSGGRIG